MTIATDACNSTAAAATTRNAIRPYLGSARAAIPGIAVAGTIALIAYGLRHIPGLGAFSPLILAILIGILVRNLVGTPSFARAGISFSLRHLLRLAIVLLGFQLTLGQIAELGTTGLLIVATTLLATFAFTVAAGRTLGVDRKLSELIAAGTSICGASAIIAANSVVEGSDEDVAYAIACVTIFGSIAMFVYPLIPGLLHLDFQAYGLWSGASIHEIAQVIAASFQNGQRAGEIGTVAKLARVHMPLIKRRMISPEISVHSDNRSANPALNLQCNFHLWDGRDSKFSGRAKDRSIAPRGISRRPNRA